MRSFQAVLSMGITTLANGGLSSTQWQEILLPHFRLDLHASLSEIFLVFPKELSLHSSVASFLGSILSSKFKLKPRPFL